MNCSIRLTPAGRATANSTYPEKGPGSFRGRPFDRGGEVGERPRHGRRRPPLEARRKDLAPVAKGWDKATARLTTAFRSRDEWVGLYDGASDISENYEETMREGEEQRSPDVGN